MLAAEWKRVWASEANVVPSTERRTNLVAAFGWDELLSATGQTNCLSGMRQPEAAIESHVVSLGREASICPNAPRGANAAGLLCAH